VIFLAAFFIETISVLQDQYSTELVDSSNEESDEENENSKKGWNDEFIASNFNFQVTLINTSLSFTDQSKTKSNQQQSIFSPPPDLI
jgi:hypothetical protein